MVTLKTYRLCNLCCNPTLRVYNPRIRICRKCGKTPCWDLWTHHTETTEEAQTRETINAKREQFAAYLGGVQ